MKKENNKNSVVLLLTSNISSSLIKNYHSIKDGFGERGDVVVLFHDKDEGGKKITENTDIRFSRFTNESLKNQQYIPLANTLVPGSNHFPILLFSTENRYDYYWCIEDDVRFNGNWADFFQAFDTCRHDFISAQIETFAKHPSWFWWNTLTHPVLKIYNNQKLRSFNPVYRLSYEALQFIHLMLVNKWIGHHEVLLPTLLLLNNFSLLDFGGTGEFTPEEFTNKFYTDDGNDIARLSSTFRFRPIFNSVGEEANKLYHPVKENIK